MQLFVVCEVGIGLFGLISLRLIKQALPGCRTVLGISNVSFGLPQAAREVVNSVHRMPESVAVKQTLENLRNARSVDDIGGQDRLAEAQNHLVDLLNYLERKEGYSYFPAKRKKCSSCRPVKSARPVRSVA